MKLSRFYLFDDSYELLKTFESSTDLLDFTKGTNKTYYALSRMTKKIYRIDWSPLDIEEGIVCHDKNISEDERTKMEIIAFLVK